MTFDRVLNRGFAMRGLANIAWRLVVAATMILMLPGALPTARG